MFNKSMQANFYVLQASLTPDVVWESLSSPSSPSQSTSDLRALVSRFEPPTPHCSRTASAGPTIQPACGRGSPVSLGRGVRAGAPPSPRVRGGRPGSQADQAAKQTRQPGSQLTIRPASQAKMQLELEKGDLLFAEGALEQETGWMWSNPAGKRVAEGKAATRRASVPAYCCS